MSNKKNSKRRKRIKSSFKSSKSSPKSPKIQKQSPPPRIIAKKRIPTKPSHILTQIPIKESPKKQRAPRRKVSLESHLTKYENLEKMLDEEIDRRANNKEKGTRIFRSIRKIVRELHKEAPKLANAKRKFTTKNGEKSGFSIQCEITDELARFMKLEEGDTPTRHEITNAICVYVHVKEGETREHMLRWNHLNPGGKRDLRRPDNLMIIKPDRTLSQLLRYDQYMKDIEEGKISIRKTDKITKEKKMTIHKDPALFFWAVQKLVKIHVVRTLTDKSEAKNETIF